MVEGVGVGVAVFVLEGPASRFTARGTVLVISIHSWLRERLERSSRPGESNWTRAAPGARSIAAPGASPASLQSHAPSHDRSGAIGRCSLFRLTSSNAVDVTLRGVDARPTAVACGAVVPLHARGIAVNHHGQPRVPPSQWA